MFFRPVFKIVPLILQSSKKLLGLINENKKRPPYREFSSPWEAQLTGYYHSKVNRRDLYECEIMKVHFNRNGKSVTALFQFYIVTTFFPKTLLIQRIVNELIKE
jgi:hypothetical protein